MNIIKSEDGKMTVKMKHSDLERAVKEYIEKLFVGSQVIGVT